MIKSPKLLNAKHSIRPYKHHINTEGLYNNDGVNCVVNDELTDDQIEYLINCESDNPGMMRSDYDVKSELYGDEYADAMMKELGL